MTTPAASPVPSPAPSTVGGADLLRSVGLFVDGPALWGHSGPANRPGVFVVELPAPQQLVQIDPSAVRAWLERVPDLRLDGGRPTVAELQARLASFWLPGQTILYIGASAKSLGARLAGMNRTTLGDRRPQSAGYWLKTLHDLARTRIWWAETDDPELYEDAALDAFQAAAGALPFAVLATPSGQRKPHGLTGALLDNEVAAQPRSARSAADARSAELANARASRLGLPRSAVGGSEPDDAAARRAAARGAAARRAASPSPARTGGAPQAARPKSGARRVTAEQAPSAIVRATTRAPKTPTPTQPAIQPSYLSAAGLGQLQSELDELTIRRRPEVIARIKAARELGDLSENGDYEAARKEQSFLEGRVQQLEQLIKYAVVIDESQLGHEVVLGSTVVVETDRHGEETFTIVGSAEADAAAGKISYTSPIGHALMGKHAGETVQIHVPAGKMEFRVLEVR